MKAGKAGRGRGWRDGGEILSVSKVSLTDIQTDIGRGCLSCSIVYAAKNDKITFLMCDEMKVGHKRLHSYLRRISRSYYEPEAFQSEY